MALSLPRTFFCEDDTHLLEKKISTLQEHTPSHQRAFLFNDTQNYLMSKLEPLESWYAPREAFIREYAALDWLALGNALSHVHGSAHGNPFYDICVTIHQGFRTLLSEINRPQHFSLTLLCSTLGKIDYMSHILLPSHYAAVVDPAALHVLDRMGHWKPV